MIKHIKCDIFESGADVICHQVNCQGVMGSGVAKQVREKFPDVYEEYKTTCNECEPYQLLGSSQFVKVNNIFYIANLFAQEEYGYDGKCYTNYDSLKNCLYAVRDYTTHSVIAIPYLMGCHRGGGDWNIVYKMIEEVFGDSDCEVLICEYNGG